MPIKDYKSKRGKPKKTILSQNTKNLSFLILEFHIMTNNIQGIKELKNMLLLPEDSHKVTSFIRDVRYNVNITLLRNRCFFFSFIVVMLALLTYIRLAVSLFGYLLFGVLFLFRHKYYAKLYGQYLERLKALDYELNISKETKLDLVSVKIKTTDFVPDMDELEIKLEIQKLEYKRLEREKEEEKGKEEGEETGRELVKKGEEKEVKRVNLMKYLASGKIRSILVFPGDEKIDKGDKKVRFKDLDAMKKIRSLKFDSKNMLGKAVRKKRRKKTGYYKTEEIEEEPRNSNSRIKSDPKISEAPSNKPKRKGKKKESASSLYSGSSQAKKLRVELQNLFASMEPADIPQSSMGLRPATPHTIKNKIQAKSPKNEQSNNLLKSICPSLKEFTNERDEEHGLKRKRSKSMNNLDSENSVEKKSSLNKSVADVKLQIPCVSERASLEEESQNDLERLCQEKYKDHNFVESDANFKTLLGENLALGKKSRRDLLFNRKKEKSGNIQDEEINNLFCLDKKEGDKVLESFNENTVLNKGICLTRGDGKF